MLPLFPPLCVHKMVIMLVLWDRSNSALRRVYFVIQRDEKKEDSRSYLTDDRRCRMTKEAA